MDSNKTKRPPGRPKGTTRGNVYTERLQVLLSKGGVERVRARARKAGLALSAYVRQMLGED